MEEKTQANGEDEEEKENGDEKKNGEEEFDTSSDPVITDAFASIKAAILSKRTDIVRQILCAAESIREEDYDSDDDEGNDRNTIRDKYDSDEYIDMLSLLLRHKDTDSGTLLHIATRVGSADIVRTLLAAGSSCLVENHEKKNAFQYCESELVKSAYVNELLQAVSQSRVFRVEHLLKAGIDVNSPDGSTSMNSVLHWAASYANLTTLQFLIQRGADVNACNNDGATPLHDAMDRKDADIVEEQLKSGADLDIKATAGSHEGKSPRDLAASEPALNHLLQMYSEEKKCNGEEMNGHGSEPHRENGAVHESVPLVKDFNGNISRKLSTSSTSSASVGKAASAKPMYVKLDPMVSYLSPPPQKVKQMRGLYFVPPQEMTLYIKSSQDDVIEMSDVIEMFVDKFQKVGIKLTCEYLHSGTKLLSRSHMQCIINQNSFTHKEEYRIQISTHKVFIISSCLASLFYGLSTFLQCLKLYRGKAMPLLQINDWSKCPHRSIVLDFCENDLPNIDILLQSIDLLSSFKINQIQLNVDHLHGNNNELSYSKSESLRIQLFCKKRYVSVVPYLKMNYGSPLIGSSGNNGVPGLDLDAFKDRVDPFLFAKSIHVELMFNENQKLIDQLHAYCQASGHVFQLSCRDMDVQPNQIPYLSNGILCTVDALATSKHQETMDELGLQYVASYDCAELNRIYPDMKELVSNVYDVFSRTPLCHCAGFSMKYAFRSKRIFSFMTLLPSLVMSSSMLWNLNDGVKDGLYILNVINYLICEDDKDLVGNMFIEVGKALPLIIGEELFEEKSCLHSLFDSLLEGCSIDISLLDSVSLQKISKTIKVMKQDLLSAKVESSLSEPFLKESSILLNLVFFLARLMSLKSKKEVADLKHLPNVNKSDESNRLMAIIQDYETYCSKYCKSTGNDYVTITLLRDILEKIMPRNGVKSESVYNGLVDY